jgi:methylated-DNA-[protein]-cysteine S-methyltransferase
VNFALFETPLGTAGLVWTDRGLAGVELPSAEPARVRARLRRRFPGASEASSPPAHVARWIAALTKVLGGEASDLSEVDLDTWGVPELDLQVYRLARQIPFGKTSTYGDIARQLGDVHLARDVGQALSRNPFPIVVPCHRVIAANGRLGGFSAVGGVTTKQRLLAAEQASGNWQMPLALS